jgi:transposase-like protein|tara:strand:- start:150 stop:296 length:147 start_codon:yes stop_codon:yes gene_type:complete
MPKRQAIIQECEKCKTTFSRYEETPLCDACYGIEKAVKTFNELENEKE